MKVIPVGSPADIKVAPPSDMKAKAVAAFNSAAQAQDAQANVNHSVQLNQNNISPEDLSAVKAQSIDKNAITEEIQQVSEETPKTQESTAPEKTQRDPALSRQFAQLARQEKVLRAKVQQQEQAIKAREAAISAKEAALEAQSQQYTQSYISKDQLKSDTLTALAEAGISYDELTQQILNQQPTDPRLLATINKLEAKIKDLEKSTEDSKKNYSDNQAAAYQAAVKQIETDARSLVKHDPNFETIRATNSVKDVVELITQTYDKDGVLLTVEEAAQEVENYLVEEAMKLTRIGKIKSRLAQSGQTKPTTQKTQAQPKQQQSTMKTLTNATSSTRQLSARERAVLAFKGELKG